MNYPKRLKVTSEKPAEGMKKKKKKMKMAMGKSAPASTKPKMGY